MGSYIPPAPDARVVDIDQDPTPKVELHWIAQVHNDIRQDYLNTNSSTKITNSLSWLSAHAREIVGYRVHRGDTEEFTPTGEAAGQGNCLADENTLSYGVHEYTDTTVNSSQQYYYKVCMIIDKGDL